VDRFDPPRNAAGNSQETTLLDLSRMHYFLIVNYRKLSHPIELCRILGEEGQPCV
jgi:hypothetical protein